MIRHALGALLAVALIGYWLGKRMHAVEQDADAYRQLAVEASQNAVEALHIVQKQRTP